MNNNEWQPIETAPKDGTDIIGYIPSDNMWGGVMGLKWHEPQTKKWDGREIIIDGYWCKSVSTQSVCNPTHWMPLPTPPTQ